MATSPNPSSFARALYLVVSIFFWLLLAFGGLSIVVSISSMFRDDRLTVGARSVIPEHAVEIVLELAVLWTLRRLAGSIRSGTPFTRENVGRLRILALVFFAGFPLARLLGAVLLMIASRGLGVAFLGNAVFGVVFEALVTGLSFLVLSEVFSHGVRLRKDVEGTV